MLTHLVKVPLTLRPAVAADVPSLMRLQANSGAAPQVIHPMIPGILAQQILGTYATSMSAQALSGKAMHKRTRRMIERCFCNAGRR